MEVVISYHTVVWRTQQTPIHQMTNSVALTSQDCREDSEGDEKDHKDVEQLWEGLFEHVPVGHPRASRLSLSRPLGPFMLALVETVEALQVGVGKVSVDVWE